jgi:hypothetical protein
MSPLRPALIASLLLLVSCHSSESDKAALRNRIRAGRAEQYCRPDACFNPSILSTENEYDVTAFAGAKPVLARVPLQKLHSYLLGLPLSAWPQGPAIIITPTDVVDDGQAVQRNLRQAEVVCRELGLEVQIRPGG